MTGEPTRPGLKDRLIEGTGHLLGRYVKLVYSSSKIEVVPADAFARAHERAPAIFAFWHGQFLMACAARPLDIEAHVMVARNKGASIAAIAAESQGTPTIRASGAHDARRARRKGGSAGFLRALDLLADGRSVLMTADIPKVAQVAGRGVIHLARASGRPIIPVAYVSARAIHLNNWDRMAIDLPGGPAIICHGQPLDVPADTPDTAIDAFRETLSRELDRISALAHDRLGIARHFRPGPHRHD